MGLPKEIFELISKYLDVCEYCKCCWIQRIPFNLAEAMLSYPPPPCGPRRLQLWSMLILHSNYTSDHEFRSSGKSSSSKRIQASIPSSSSVSSLTSITIEEYDNLASANSTTANTLSNGQVGEIMRDVLRTFPTHSFFQSTSPGSKMLPRILRAVASYYSDVGYCQGMNFVVGVLILGRVPNELTGGVHLPSAQYTQRGDHSRSDENASDNAKDNDKDDHHDDSRAKDEERNADSEPSQEGQESTSAETPSEPVVSNADELASQEGNFPGMVAATLPWEDTMECKQAEYDIFLFVEKLLDKQGKLGMAGLWQSKAPSMKLRVYQLDRILRWMLPRLHAHFIEIQLTPEVIVAQWFITLFSYTVPLQWTMQIWGYVFCEGWPALFRVVLSLLQILEDTILDVDLEGLSMMMKNWKNQVLSVASSHHEIMKNAHTMLLNDEVLLKLQEAYALEIISLSELAISVPTPILLAGEAQESPNISKSTQATAASSSVSEAGGSSPRSSITKLGPVIAVPVGPLVNPSSIGAPNTRSWLYRYCEALPDYVITDIHRVRDELQQLEQQVDADKGIIQQKIQLACSNQFLAQEEFEAALQEQLKWIVDVSHYSQELEVALFQAQRYSTAASMDIEDLEYVEDDRPPSPSSSPRYKTIYSSSDAVTAEEYNRYSYDNDFDPQHNSESLLEESSIRNQMIARSSNEDASVVDGVWHDRPSITASSYTSNETVASTQTSTPIGASIGQAKGIDSDDDTPQRFATPWTIGTRNVSTTAGKQSTITDSSSRPTDSDDESPLRHVIGSSLCMDTPNIAISDSTGVRHTSQSDLTPLSVCSVASEIAMNLTVDGVSDSDDESTPIKVPLEPFPAKADDEEKYSKSLFEVNAVHSSTLNATTLSAEIKETSLLSKALLAEAIRLTDSQQVTDSSLPTSSNESNSGRQPVIGLPSLMSPEPMTYSQSPPTSNSRSLLRFRLFGQRGDNSNSSMSPASKQQKRENSTTSVTSPSTMPNLEQDTPSSRLLKDKAPVMVSDRQVQNQPQTPSDDSESEVIEGHAVVGDAEEASQDLKLLLSSFDNSTDQVEKVPSVTKVGTALPMPGHNSQVQKVEPQVMASSAPTSATSLPSDPTPQLSTSAPKSTGFFVKGRVGYRVYQLASAIAASTPRASRVKYEFVADQYPWRLPPPQSRSNHFNVNKWKEKRLAFISELSKAQQQNIIHASRELEAAKTRLADATRRLSDAKAQEEEAATLKVVSCDELHRLVEDANRARSQKLKYITDSYMI